MTPTITSRLERDKELNYISPPASTITVSESETEKPYTYRTSSSVKPIAGNLSSRN